MQSLAPDSGSSFREREIGERRQPGGGAACLSPPPSPRPRPPPPSARAAPPPTPLRSSPPPPSGRGKKARRAGQARGPERRRPERERRAQAVAAAGAALAAAPAEGAERASQPHRRPRRVLARLRARAPRIACSPGIQTLPAPGGLRQAGGGEEPASARGCALGNVSAAGPERVGGGSNSSLGSGALFGRWRRGALRGLCKSLDQVLARGASTAGEGKKGFGGRGVGGAARGGVSCLEGVGGGVASSPSQLRRLGLRSTQVWARSSGV